MTLPSKRKGLGTDSEALPEAIDRQEDHPSTTVTDAVENQPFQVMPPLSADEYAALKADISEYGVRVPITVDQHGRILDGHNRKAIAEELHLPYDRLVQVVADDDEARDIAYRLNLVRRHLNREQKRDLVRRELDLHPDDSDRAIARRLGCSPSTVGAIRRGDVSKLDTSERPPMTREEAEWSTQMIRDEITKGDTQILIELLEGAPPAALARAFIKLQREMVREGGISAEIAQILFEERVDSILAWPHGGWYAEEAYREDDVLRERLLELRSE